MSFYYINLFTNVALVDNIDEDVVILIIVKG